MRNVFEQSDCFKCSEIDLLGYECVIYSIELNEKPFFIESEYIFTLQDISFCFDKKLRRYPLAVLYISTFYCLFKKISVQIRNVLT